MKLAPCLALLALAVALPAQAQTKPKPATPAPAAAGQVRTGDYECWANGSARMGMNFTVTGPGAYRNESGAGKFTVGAGGVLKLTGPMLESMPDGFIAVYHVPSGHPTVSFRSPRGAEAAFCEHVGK